jgi:hypothetical protein
MLRLNSMVSLASTFVKPFPVTWLPSCRCLAPYLLDILFTFQYNYNVDKYACGVSGGSATALAHILSGVCTSVAEGRIAPKEAIAIARAGGVLFKCVSKSREQAT